MKISLVAVMLVGAALLVSLMFFDSRERSFSSSYAAVPENPASPQSAGQPSTYNFDSDKVGAPPAKFHFARTGNGAEGKWEVAADPTAPSKPNVVAQTSTDSTDYRSPLLIADEGSFKDLERA